MEGDGGEEGRRARWEGVRWGGRGERVGILKSSNVQRLVQLFAGCRGVLGAACIVCIALEN